MPCAVSQEEKDYYERKVNFEKFGAKELNHRITESVCCEVACLLTNKQVEKLSSMARKWIDHHHKRDNERTQKELK